MKSLFLMMAMIPLILWSSCAADGNKGIQFNSQTGDHSCVFCHSENKTVMPDGHPVMENIDAESRQLIKKIFDSRHTSNHLDALHFKNDLSCSDCHGNTMPELDASIENRICFGCHDSYKKLAEATADTNDPDKNPHQSHLGEIDCVVCHHAHSASKAYCTTCHLQFVMPIPGGKDK